MLLIDMLLGLRLAAAAATVSILVAGCARGTVPDAGGGPAASPAVQMSTSVSSSAGTATAVTGTAVTVSPGATGTGAASSATPAPAPTPTAPAITPAGTGAYGYVSAGPTCPVERPDMPCPPRPVSARVDAQDGSGRTVASTHTDAAGRYSLGLAPGSYTLVVVTGTAFPRCPPTAVTVRSGAPTRADIGCDTGIR